MIERLKLENFTAFTKLDVSFSPGINIFVGENGSGKTHVLKVLYSFLAAISKEEAIPTKIANVFLPDNFIGLIKRGINSANANIAIYKNGEELSYAIEKSETVSLFSRVNNFQKQIEKENAVYIPVKEMIANAPGFASLYKERYLHFEEVYADIISKALLPSKREISPAYSSMCKKLEHYIGGSVYSRDEQFYLHGNTFDLEFSLLAEGLRKLGLLWVLLQNGSLDKGSVLFWDEPEANINPQLIPVLVDVLLELQRNGVQLFLATHDYNVAKYFEVKRKDGDKVLYHSLFKTDNGVKSQSDEYFGKLQENSIIDADEKLLDEV